MAMAQTVVICPNCETSFPVNVNAIRGKCPSCDISLIFEDISGQPTQQPPQQAPETQNILEPMLEEPSKLESNAIEESVDIGRIEAAVDAIVEQTVTDRKTRAADIAAVESIELDRDYSDLEKKVEKLLSKE